MSLLYSKPYSKSFFFFIQSKSQGLEWSVSLFPLGLIYYLNPLNCTHTVNSLTTFKSLLKCHLSEVYYGSPIYSHMYSHYHPALLVLLGLLYFFFIFIALILSNKLCNLLIIFIVDCIPLLSNVSVTRAGISVSRGIF